MHLTLVSQSKHQRLEFSAFVARKPAVLSSQAVTDDADYTLRVQVVDLSALNDFLTSLLAKGPDRMHVRSLVVLDTIKSG